MFFYQRLKLLYPFILFHTTKHTTFRIFFPTAGPTHQPLYFAEAVKQSPDAFIILSVRNVIQNFAHFILREGQIHQTAVKQNSAK